MEPTMVRDLEAVRRRRAELRDTMEGVRAALAEPDAEPVVWGERVHHELARLALDFAEHVDVTEGAGGLHQTIVENAPRLAHAVSGLTAEHDEIETDLLALVQSAEAPVMAADVEGIRERGAALLARLAKHRQRGADLVYEALEQDLGAGD